VRGARPATAAAIANDPFYQCRLSPFTSHGMSHIPDASESRKVMVDHRLMNTFTFGASGMIELLICPTIPSSVWCRDPSPGTSFAQLNGVPIVTYRKTYVPINLTEWDNQVITYNNTAQDYDEVDLLYQASQMRFASIGWSITPISAAINTSGMIKITPVNFNFSEPVPAIGKVDVASWNDSSNTEYNNNQVMLTFHTDTDVFSKGLNKDTRMFPFATGANGILKHNGDEYAFRTVHHQMVLPVTDGRPGSITEQISLATLDYRYQLPPTIETGAAILSWDNDWNATLINITGGTPGTSFVLDNIYCIEYVPNPNGNVYALAQPSPPSKPIVLKAARDTANEQPIAKPGGLSTIVSAVSTIGAVGAKIASALA